MHFRILGPLEVLDGDEAVPLAGAKQRRLLAILLLHANAVVSTDELIESLWPEGPPESGSTALQVRVSNLRKALGPAGAALVTQSPGYVLRVAGDELDLHSFERLVEGAEGAEPSVASAQLGEALGLWRGRALSEFAYDNFAQAAIARLEELRLVALERRIDADLALGRHVRLVAELEELVHDHPLREAFAGQLMLALYRSGRQADALGVYRRTRERLVAELGLEPGRTLQDLEQAILRHDELLDLGRAAVPLRSVVVVPLPGRAIDGLLALAESVARTPRRELILARVVDGSELATAAVELQAQRDGVLARGGTARVAVFTSVNHGRDLVRLATEQDADLLLLQADASLLEGETMQAVLAGAPCDVAVVVDHAGPRAAGPVLVPFTGAEHDWTAVELGAWVSANEGVPLRLVGPSGDGHDASRLLARASLAVQRALGLDAEPLLVAPGVDGLLAAARDASVVVLGLSGRWPRDGLGTVRTALATSAAAPVVIARRGLRPGGLAPADSYTRFTWSLRPV
jgi:DNA-binding SARP family transcriptional activator